MTHKKIILSLCFILAGGILFHPCSAQNTDSLVAQARHLAFEDHDYAQAAAVLRPVQNIPGNTELLVFLGRIYAWNKQPDSARAVLRKALGQDGHYIETYIALTDLEAWEKNYDTALSIAQQGLALDNTNKELLLRKARVLYYKKEYKEALAVADTLLRADKGNTQARSLAGLVRDNISKNRVGIKYDYIYFDKQFPDPWHYLSLDYTYQSKAGAFTARINYANRFGSDGLQYELEAYPILSRRFYAYLNVAHSDKAGVFPKWKSGASLYANLPSAFEAELGIRHLYFSKDAFIFTAYIGKYIKNFLLGARTYLAPDQQNLSATYSFTARYYYGGVDDYIGLTTGIGISPDDRQINIQLDNPYKLKTYRGELLLRHSIRKLNIIVFNISLARQEYRPMTSGYMLQSGIGYIRRF